MLDRISDLIAVGHQRADICDRPNRPGQYRGWTWAEFEAHHRAALRRMAKSLSESLLIAAAGMHGGTAHKAAVERIEQLQGA